MAKKIGRSIVVRKEEVVEGGHHGGAWKVAYADFVTAMMAFFLLMWLLNATTEAQKRGLADYFSPIASVSKVPSGKGGPFGGHTPYDDGPMISDRGAMAVMNDKTPPVDVEDDDSDVPAQSTKWRDSGSSDTEPQKPGHATPASAIGAGAVQARSAAEKAAAQEAASFQAAAAEMRQAIQADPQYAELSKQLSVDVTPQGLRVQIMDEDKRPMFPSGSAVMNDRARMLLLKVAPILLKLPESLSITGHTDAAPFHGGDRTNWELSAERANATRRILVEAGLPELRVRRVAGDADRDLLLPADPMAAANRRIAITVLREERSKPILGAPPSTAALSSAAPASATQAASTVSNTIAAQR